MAAPRPDQAASDVTISVGSAHVELGDAFRGTARERVLAAAAKYLGHLTNAAVHVAREGNAYRCSVQMQMGGQTPASGEAQAGNVPLAFQAAMAKVAKQLRRRKRLQREDRAHVPDRRMTA